MTEMYDWNAMPHQVDVKCPSCSCKATFEFAEVVKIELKKDIEFFKNSSVFEYEVFKDACGHKWHGALYCAGLHGGDVNAIDDLPDGYKKENWSHSRYLYRSHGLDIGSVNCSGCFLRRNHQLNWPEEAYFSIEYKGHQLWAFNRESAAELREYIHGSVRKHEKYKWNNFLLHVPAVFKRQGTRDHVVKKLSRLLAS